MDGTDRFSYTDNGACLIVHDDKTGINRASCYSIEDAVAICAALNKVVRKLTIQMCKGTSNESLSCKDQVELPVFIKNSGHTYLKFCKRCSDCELKQLMILNESTIRSKT